MDKVVSKFKIFNIIPDSKLENDKIDHLTQALNIYKTMFQRIKDKDQNFISYEIVLVKDNPTFNFTVSNGIAGLFEKTLLSVFPNVTIKEVEEDPIQINPKAIKTIEYKNHFFLAMKVDKRSNWLNYLLEVLPLMNKEDKAIVQILSVPLHNDWSNDVQAGYKQFKEGEIPRKFRMDKKLIGEIALKTTASIVAGAHNVAVELLGGTPEKFDFYANERSLMLRDGGLNSETVQKAKYGGFNVQISIVLECEKERIPTILRGIETAFLCFDGDNSLIPKKVPMKHFELIKKRKKASLINNYFSSLELSRLFLLPNKSLQEKYKINALKIQQTRIPNVLTKDGLLLGYGLYKGIESNIYLPINNYNELCLPHCTIGGMGSGKTGGYGANILVESYLKGFGSLMIDPAKKEVTAQIKEIMNPDEYQIINIKDLKPCFDFVESKYSEDPKAYLSDTILNFFEDTLEGTTGRTERYLRAFIIAMQTTKLNEIFDIMEDKEYLKKVISKMEKGIHRSTLEQYEKESDAQRMNIIKPIYNRFDQIMGDPFLNKCFNNTITLDFVDIFSQKRIFVIDLSTSDGLTKNQINVIGNLLMVKMNLAMYLRSAEKQDPFFVIIDEPHQFNKSAKLWKDIAVESRKYRVGFHFLFHYWEQIPKDPRLAIQNALPHYHLYSTSKSTWKEFIDEVKPFDLDECMKVKLKHAINIIRANGESLPPFMCNMALPPAIRLKNRLKDLKKDDKI